MIGRVQNRKQIRKSAEVSPEMRGKARTAQADAFIAISQDETADEVTQGR